MGGAGLPELGRQDLTNPAGVAKLIAPLEPTGRRFGGSLQGLTGWVRKSIFMVLLTTHR
jgi:hypothetical protein